MNISIRQGETLEIDVIADDVTAQTVQMLASNTEEGTIINETFNFSTTDGVRSATIRIDDTEFELGDYSYMLTITYSDGIVDKLPDVAECDGCSLPTLTICESLQPGVS